MTSFEREQTKLMYLIVVRSDLTGFQHLHPVFANDGTFTIAIRLPRPGTYRAIADFTTGGRRYALGVPLLVPGTAGEMPLPGPSETARTDAFSVESTHEAATAGSEVDFRFTIRRGDDAVTALLPYLGAYGHLVALRKSDLAYAHVHPTASRRRSGSITFATELPTGGLYRLFLQFKTATGIHTAAFTIDVEA